MSKHCRRWHHIVIPVLIVAASPMSVEGLSLTDCYNNNNLIFIQLKLVNRFEIGADKVHIAVLVFSEQVLLEFALDT